MYAVSLHVCIADLVRYVFMHHMPASRYDLHLKLAWSHACQKTRKTAVMYSQLHTASPHLTSLTTVTLPTSPPPHPPKSCMHARCSIVQ